jgi:hypothetical protein
VASLGGWLDVAQRGTYRCAGVERMLRAISVWAALWRLGELDMDGRAARWVE